MIEIIRTFQRGPIRSVLFDFDGTLSLIREGWQEVMISFMTEILHELDPLTAEQELRTYVKEYVTRLTGKQTIYQMIQLAEEIRMRGGNPEDPLVYKRRYHERLWTRIQDRIEGLQSGRYQPQDWLVPGSLAILENLRKRGIRMYLASGTDEVFVRQEADLLGLTSYFDGHVHGAQDQYRLFSKKMVIQRVLSEQNLKGREFVAFGDGYVEIENTKEVGGVAVGVATEERLRSGLLDRWKRERLIAAGADVIIPDFADQQRVISYLTGEID
ncbi:MAG: HAD family hydrolase [Acidobacteriota bacterium]